MATVTSLNNLSPLQKIKWSKSVLKIMKPKLVMQNFSSKPDMITKGDGQTLRFTRQIRHGKLASDMSSITNGANSGKGTEVVTPTFTQFDLAPEYYANYQTFLLLDTRAAFLSWVDAAKESYGDWYAESCDYLLTALVAQKCYLLRADSDAAFQIDSTATAVGTVTTLIDAAMTQADDYWNGGVIVWKTGKNEGLSRVVTDFDAATDTFTFAALPNAHVSGDQYHVCTTTGLTTLDTLGIDVVRKAVRTHKDNNVPTIDGTNYVGIVDAFVEFDFAGALVSVAQYTEKGIKKIFDNEIGICYGVRWVFTNKIYRADAALYAANVNGLVRVPLIIGKGAYGSQLIDALNTPTLTLQSPLSGSTDPNETLGMLGIKVGVCSTMLNAMNVIGIACVPSE